MNVHVKGKKCRRTSRIRYDLIALLTYCKNNSHLPTGKTISEFSSKKLYWGLSFSEEKSQKISETKRILITTSLFRTCFYYFVSNICHNILLGRTIKVKKVKEVHETFKKPNKKSLCVNYVFKRLNIKNDFYRLIIGTIYNWK